MTGKKRNPKGETVGLKLTKAERNLLLDGLTSLPSAIERAIRDTPPAEPVLVALDDLDDLADRVSAEADRAEDKKIQAKLGVISRKIEDILDRYREPPEPGGAAGFAETILDRLAGEPPVILPMPSRSKKGEDQYPVKLTDKQRDALIAATRLRRGLKTKIGQVPEGTQTIGITRKELEEIASEVDLAIDFAPSPYKKRLVAVLEKLEDLLDALQDEPVKPDRTSAKTSDQIYQLKVTLKDIKPPVWRRVQVPDCTLGDLHEVLQIVMGWDDGHLHQFIVNGEYYGQRDPEGDDFGMEVEDEESVLLSRIIKGDRKIRFKYEYDFGDGWQHEIQFERIVEREPKAQYPRCVDGARACPPEDVGGPGSYADFLEAMADPNHEQHEELREWVGDEFDPEEFSVEEVNEELRQYLRGQ